MAAFGVLLRSSSMRFKSAALRDCLPLAGNGASGFLAEAATGGVEAGLAGAALTGAALTGAALTGAALTGAALTGAGLAGAGLAGACFTACAGACLAGVALVECFKGFFAACLAAGFFSGCFLAVCLFFMAVNWGSFRSEGLLRTEGKLLRVRCDLKLEPNASTEGSG